ncbi:hypothetical protein [Phenylobacterium sp.]|uniref:hypothetical protein n=1 Tax=Phenylobacterium sp. TaxID=1871053 RepID=UPI00301E12E2
MTHRALAFIATAGIALSGCNRHAEPTGGGAGDGGGRYTGVGIYQADRMWRQLSVPAPREAAAARVDDDSHVIVVIDSRTGELRQCGNLSGHCIGMSPWTRPLTPAQLSPAPLVKHAAQLDAEPPPEPSKPVR